MGLIYRAYTFLSGTNIADTAPAQWNVDIDQLYLLVNGNLDSANILTTGATGLQPWDQGLTDIAALAVTDGNFIVGSGSAWVAESGATARTSLGLGSIATQDANAVALTGGSITGTTFDGAAVGSVTPGNGTFSSLESTGHITMAGALFHASDTDTYISFIPDKQYFFCGGIQMLLLNENGTQDVVEVGSLGLVDFDVAGGALYVDGSTGITTLTGEVRIDGVGADIDAILDLQLDGVSQYETRVDDSVSGDPVTISLRGVPVAEWSDDNTLPELRLGPTNTETFIAYQRIEDNSLEGMGSNQHGLRVDMTRTTETTTSGALYGLYSWAEMNDTDGDMGNLMGGWFRATLTDGAVTNLVGAAQTVKLIAGTVNIDVQAVNANADINGGTVTDETIAVRAKIDIESGATLSDVWGVDIWWDDQSTPSGTTALLHLNDVTTADYAILQTGVSPSFLGGYLQVMDTPGGITGDYLFSAADVAYSAPANLTAAIKADLTRTAGSGSNLAHLYGADIRAEMDQTGVVGGFLEGLRVLALLTAGDVGDGTPRSLIAVEAEAEITAGTVTGSARGVQATIDINGGTVSDYVVGVRTRIDIESAATVSGDVYGYYLDWDVDDTIGGTGYGIYIEENTGMDFSYYAPGSAPALMGGHLEIDGDLNHDGSGVGFYDTAPVAKQTGVAVSAAGIHAALVNLGLIT